MQQPVWISCGEILLGTIALADVREMLQGGFLKPGDHFRFKDVDSWRPLAELEQFVPRPEKLLARRQAALSVAANLAETVRSVGTRVGTIITGTKAEMAASSQKLLENSMPELQRLVSSQIVQAKLTARSALQDEAFMRKVFAAAHDCLPRPVRRFVSEDQFVQFCIKHQQRLLQAPGSGSAR